MVGKRLFICLQSTLAIVSKIGVVLGGLLTGEQQRLVIINTLQPWLALYRSLARRSTKDRREVNSFQLITLAELCSTS